MFEGVVRLEHTYFTEAKGRARVEFDGTSPPLKSSNDNRE